MSETASKQDKMSRPASVLALAALKKPLAKRFDMVVPPPVPEKDFPPAIPRPMTGSSRRLSSGTIMAAQKKKIKYGRGRFANVELVPRPSDDPEDPLNWPQWRKELNFVALLIMVGLVGGMKTAFVTTGERMAAEFNVSYTAVAALTAVPLILSAFSGMASSIIASIWGKRPTYLISFVFIFIGTIWNMTTRTSFSQCMGARVFQGLGWGAYDTLILGSIQDTYFEHQRHLRVSIYNVFTIATTWGPPLIGGIASRNADSFTVQFRIINTFYLAAVPMLVFGAPETAFDRSKATISLDTAPAPAASPVAWRVRIRHALNKDKVLEYLGKMRPFTFRSEASLAAILKLPRAVCAPTTGLIVLLSLIPYGTLWGSALSLSGLLNAGALDNSPAFIGALVAGPWIASTIVPLGLCFWPAYSKTFGSRVNCMTTGAGAALSFAGVLSFGMVVHREFTESAERNLNFPLLSFLLGLLAAGVSTLDATTRPLIARSASFTSPSVAVSQRSVSDMSAGVVAFRNAAAGIFVVAFPGIGIGGLKAAAIALGTVHVAVAGAVAALWWFREPGIWRLDGRIMGLVDLSLLKDQSGSFFDTE